MLTATMNVSCTTFIFFRCSAIPASSLIRWRRDFRALITLCHRSLLMVCSAACRVVSEASPFRRSLVSVAREIPTELRHFADHLSVADSYSELGRQRSSHRF